MASNVKIVIERALKDWIDEIYIGCDSEIALAWTIYENVKLNVFHRHRVNNIRSKVRLEQLHHVQGIENCADVGTRPDNVNVECLLPGAPWLSGREWMKVPHEEALAKGVIKSVKDIKLTNEAKKQMKEGIVFDQFEADQATMSAMQINTIDHQKIADCEAFSDYIFPPLKRSFRPTVRIVALILLAVRKFKEGLVRRKARADKTKLSELEALRSRKVRFTIFQTNTDVFDKNTKSHANVFENNPNSLTDVFGKQITCRVGKHINSMKNKLIIHSVKLSDEDLSEALEYLFKKCTQEILKFENMKEVQKLGVMRDDILFCSSRI